MTVDRGGLDYKIKTAGDFKALEKFRDLVKTAKKEMRDLISLKKKAGFRSSETASSVKRKAVAAEKKQNDILRRRQRLERDLAALNNKSLQSLKTRVSKQRELIAQQRKMDMLKNRSIKKLQKEAAIAKELRTLEIRAAKLRSKELQDRKRQLSVEQQIARFKEKQAKFAALGKFARQQGLAGNQQALSDLGISRSRAQGMGLLALPERQVAKKATVISSALDKIRRVSDRVGASITRMVTALAFFSVARGLLDGLRKLIVGMVEFNKNLETANLGIAALLITVNKVKDSQGNLVKGAKALGIAQGIAKEQTMELRKEALKTAATFEDLIFAFQTAIAPGKQAGLSLEQTRKFSVLISQAAGALGLEQNQLAEEIRSVLQGTITPRTTRIATALGIKNEDIRRAKEAGKLYEFLQEQFSGFAVAAEKTLDTFTAKITNLKDAIMLVAGAGGFDLFQSLKDLFDSLRGQFVDEDLKPRPETLQAFKELGQSLKTIVDLFKELTGGKDGASTMVTVLRTIGKTLEFVAGVLAGIADIVVMISKPIAPIVEFLGSSNSGRMIGRAIALMIAIKAVPWVAVGKAWIAMSKFFIANPPLAAMVIAVTVIATKFALIRKDLGEINGQMATWSETFKFFVEVGSTMYAKLILQMQQGIRNVGFVFQELWRGSKELFLSLIQIILQKLGELSNHLESTFKQIWFGLKELIATGLSFILKEVGSVMMKINKVIFDTLKKGINELGNLLAKLPSTAFGGATNKNKVLGTLLSVMNTLNKLSKQGSPLKGLTEGLDTAAFQAKQDATAAASPQANPFAAQLNAIAEKATEAKMSVDELKKSRDAFNKSMEEQIALMEKQSDRELVSQVLESRKRRGEVQPSRPQSPEGALADADKLSNIMKGMIAAWDEFMAGLPDDYQAALDITKFALEGFAQSVSGTIMDALDPNKNGQDIKSRWKSFFKGLANTILSTVVNNLIKKMLQKLVTSQAGTATKGFLTSIFGAAKGGMVQGFAHGGGVHGFGRAQDPRDTVPAWLRPGEFVVRPEVVRQVGVGFMEALNSGVISPLASLQGLSGVASAAKARSAPLSMATGGAVPSMAAAQAAPAVQVVPVMIAGEAQLEQLLASGQAAFRNALRANSDAVSMAQRNDDRRFRG